MEEPGGLQSMGSQKELDTIEQLNSSYVPVAGLSSGDTEVKIMLSFFRLVIVQEGKISGVEDVKCMYMIC